MKPFINTIYTGFLLLAGILSFSLQAQTLERPQIDTLCQQLDQAKEVGLKQYHLDLSEAGTNGGAVRKRSVSLYYLSVMPKDGKKFQHQLFLAEIREGAEGAKEFARHVYYYHPDGFLMRSSSKRKTKTCEAMTHYFREGDLIGLRRESGKNCQAEQLKGLKNKSEEFSSDEILQGLDVLEQAQYLSDLFQSLAQLRF